MARGRGLIEHIKPLVVVLGTNASGKSDLAIALAQHLRTEVLSADSRQVYRGFDLCSGKVTAAERATIPHHGIDIADPDTTFSLADFMAYAKPCLEGIHAQGCVPVVVGGTGLYLSALVDGYILLEVPPDLDFRAACDSQTPETLHAQLAALEPNAAKFVDASNRRRVTRALEIARAGFTYADSHRRFPQYSCLKLGVRWPDEILRKRIHERLVRRLDEGMIEEVAVARANGVSDSFLHDLGLEYRFVLQHLTGEIPNRANLEEALSTSIFKFSRRQLAWFRRDPSIHWLNMTDNYLSEGIGLVEAFVAGESSL